MIQLSARAKLDAAEVLRSKKCIEADAFFFTQ